MYFSTGDYIHSVSEVGSFFHILFSEMGQIKMKNLVRQGYGFLGIGWPSMLALVFSLRSVRLLA